ncbi:helix-turn-helix transcriptional regulator [Algoriphagus zhangzhouensis]|uniref:Predicted transcriptional regulator, ArsR family n=1 Tax=Algoriphagus zhangzhouensis TaxID=1073327 RepID=A0A1M7Z7M3_9BACT|nr:metalloregulator ArsR/SmtB family transcription factor [Algoriphagus zhangzhouensis]TDY49330.1 transcriptional regulator [Algoriphagus zhangzhouensis]SHO60780.1 Predicted transcriptional regulator, ArsR family [Algoriphagus zhangzhouensis]
MKKEIQDRILMFLKMRGNGNAQQIADEFSITKEGARKHLMKMEAEGLLKQEIKKEGVGRPVVLFSLTEKGFARFPDSHALITVQLLKSIKNLLGENALDLLINDRESHTYKLYSQQMDQEKTLEKKLSVLAEKRSEEGYMAEWKKEDGSYFLIENHCPICAAAKECQLFCRSELKNFRELLGADYQIQRVEYILGEGTRCVYKIDPKVA